MWFLQTDTLLLMLGLALLTALALRLAGAHRSVVLRFLPLLDLSVLCFVSEKLAVFYAGYTLVTWAFLWFLRRRRRARGLWFALLCLACLVPLVYSRAAGLWALPMAGLTMVGLAYNMLKAIDALYYEYYGGRQVSFEIYVNYMLFFPVLTAGPVFRYRDFEKTWLAPALPDLERLTAAAKRLIRGLFKKVVLSMLASELLTRLLARSPLWYLSLLIPVVSLGVLFFDMSGYADIAIALGGLMGLTVPENFKKPFRSASFTQFWRNWHVTVSDWIREHVYVLVSGHKLNRYQSALIGFCVMMIMSLWHGFSLLFVLDGVILGAIIALENLFGLTTVNRRKAPRWYYVLRCVITVYLFALNSLIFTLTPYQIKVVVRGFFTLTGGGL